MELPCGVPCGVPSVPFISFCFYPNLRNGGGEGVPVGENQSLIKQKWIDELKQKGGSSSKEHIRYSLFLFLRVGVGLFF